MDPNDSTLLSKLYFSFGSSVAEVVAEAEGDVAGRPFLCKEPADREIESRASVGANEGIVRGPDEIIGRFPPFAATAWLWSER